MLTIITITSLYFVFCHCVRETSKLLYGKILIGVSTVAYSNKDGLKNGGGIQNPISVKYTLQEINLEGTMVNVSII